MIHFIPFCHVFHPRKLFNCIRREFFNRCFAIKCKIHRIVYEIGENSEIYKCSVCSKKNGKIIIGNNCRLKHCVFNFYGDGGKIIIKDHVVFNARPEAKTRLFVKNESSIVIDDDCLFSNSIDISTTDWHSVIDENGRRINLEKDVFIGEHVWIGRKATICKGVSISPNSIVASCSVVTKPITESNVVIAGNPAVIKKRNINWK